MGRSRFVSIGYCGAWSQKAVLPKALKFDRDPDNPNRKWSLCSATWTSPIRPRGELLFLLVFPDPTGLRMFIPSLKYQQGLGVPGVICPPVFWPPTILKPLQLRQYRKS